VTSPGALLGGLALLSEGQNAPLPWRALVDSLEDHT
jgi:hypothetical protein